MNRYPNIIPSGGGVLGARGNGFLRRKFFTVSGSYTFTLPADLPVDDRGLIRVMGWCVGAGAGGTTEGSGAGGGFSQKELWVPPESQFSIVVGRAGDKGSLTGGTRTGGTTSITIDGKTWQATGGQVSAGGVGSGGDINTNGSASRTGSSNIPGGSAGSPWGDGIRGGTSDAVQGERWRIPSFWDLTDATEETGFIMFEAIGMGGGAYTSGPPTAFAHLPTYGGGGAGGNGHDNDGGGGIAAIYW